MMAKVPRVPKAPPGKYEGKAFLDYDEASDYLGIKRTTLYHHVVDMEIQTHKFKKNTRRYLAMADVKRIEKVIEEPWTAETEEVKITSAEEKSEADAA
jgi:hypothetical protein